ncbi:MAG: WHG domain-containing protein [Clostridia bacterium]|nr:WHG domain-containing protein [Clostridia bacterium]
MPPKVKITREAIVNAAVEIVRAQGASGVNARAVAARLNCSTQPVFSNFASMDELRLAAAGKTASLYEGYIRREVESGKYPAYKASGMAYIRFAKEEKELFKLLFMREREGENLPEEQALFSNMKSIVHENTGLSNETASLFHLEMWAFVHGIAAMFATGYLNLEWEMVSKMLTNAYQGLKKQYGTKE